MQWIPRTTLPTAPTDSIYRHTRGAVSGEHCALRSIPMGALNRDCLVPICAPISEALGKIYHSSSSALSFTSYSGLKR